MNWINAMGDICCGCNACTLICPTNAIRSCISKKGFYTVEIDAEKCIKCNVCESVCPLKQKKNNTRPLAYYGFMTKNINNRLQSQSGGAFYSFAQYFNKVMGGIVYGVTFDGVEAVYKRVENVKDLQYIRGSKYIQAKTDDVFKNVENDLKNNLRVLFSGTPCHVKGLKQYLKYKKVDVKGLFLIDLVCHGTPSPLVFKSYKKSLIDKYGYIEDFKFRDKTIGWHDHICSFKVNGKKIYSRDFVSLFYSHLCLNEICYKCPFSNLNREGDITVSDLWGSEMTYPELNDNIGTSLIIINSKAGFKLKNAIDSIEDFMVIEIDKCYQKNLYESTDKPALYEYFWDSYIKTGFEDTVKKVLNITLDEYANDEIFWSNYRIDDLLKILVDKKLYLYGIGIPMLQLIELLSDRKCKITGILDKDLISGEIGDIKVVDIDNVISSKDNIMVICSRNINNIMIITERIKEDKRYDKMKVLTLDKFIK